MSPSPQRVRRVSSLDLCDIRTGDLLLFRRPAGLIARAGRSVYCHAAKAAWWAGNLYCVEVREWHGGRIVRLEREVARRPKAIDVYETNPIARSVRTPGCRLQSERRFSQYDRNASMDVLTGFAGTSYGWWNVIRCSFLHLPFLRLMLRADIDDASPAVGPPFCSQAIAIAERLGGRVDPVPNLADRLTEPADLARSQLYGYRYTLIP